MFLGICRLAVRVECWPVAWGSVSGYNENNAVFCASELNWEGGDYLLLKVETCVRTLTWFKCLCVLCENRTWKSENTLLTWIFDNWAFSLKFFFLGHTINITFKVVYQVFNCECHPFQVAWNYHKTFLNTGFYNSSLNQGWLCFFLPLKRKGLFFPFPENAPVSSPPLPLSGSFRYCLPFRSYWLALLVLCGGGLLMSFICWYFSLTCSKCMTV